MAGTRQQKLKGGVGLHLPAGFATGHLVRLPRPPLQVVYISGSRVTQLLAVCNDGGYTLNQGGISARIVFLFRFVFLFFFFVFFGDRRHTYLRCWVHCQRQLAPPVSFAEQCRPKRGRTGLVWVECFDDGSRFADVLVNRNSATVDHDEHDFFPA